MLQESESRIRALEADRGLREHAGVPIQDWLERARGAVALRPGQRWMGILPRVVDAAVMGCCVAAAHLVTAQWAGGQPLAATPAIAWHRLVSGLTVFLLALVIFDAHGLYRRRISRSFFDEFSPLLSAVTITILLSAALHYLIYLPTPRKIFITAWLVRLAAAPLARVTTRAVQGALARRGIGVENVLIAGAGEVGQLLYAKLRRRTDLGLRVVGFMDAGGAGATGSHEVPVYQDFDAVREVLRRYHVRHILLAFPEQRVDELLWMVRTYGTMGVQFSVVPRLWEVTWPSYEMSHIEDVTVLQLRGVTLSRRGRALKRATDLVLAGLGLALLSPLFLAIAIAIKLDSHGPVLYRSHRLGRDGKPFKMLKFRSMVVDADARRETLASAAHSANGSHSQRRIFKLKGDPRVTRVGRWLRKFSLDELPQLINVARGEMSLVGPRPLPASEGEQCRDWERRRMSVLPGITGYWQIMGRSDLGFEEMMRLDYLYLQNWSLSEDFRILINTIGAVLAQKGAY